MTTKPHQCALALAIPLNRDDFLAGLKSDINKDFAKNLARKNSALTESALWETVYAVTAKRVQSVAQAVAAKGVTVVTNATLNNLQELFQKFPVVTLVAHWRSSKFYASDFIAPNQLIKALEQPSTPLAQKLASALSNNWIQHIQALECNVNARYTVPKILADDFNNVLKSSKLYPSPVPNQMCQIAPYDDDYGQYLNRLVIDDTFRGIISPGNRIEFFDQFHSIEEVVTAIPENYNGLLDFTVCNSVLIANVIKRQRRCIVLVNKKPANPDFRMVLYKGMIELLVKLDIDYMNAGAMIRRESLQ
ncbi:MAG: hypothetical protein RMY36_012765 [Nostoc sp. SerVER01]|nr:hypothetical protein [Nostoc sp. SerVER01]